METLPPSRKTALFKDRTVAFVIDLLLMLIPSAALQFSAPFLGPALFWLAYKAVFECSAIQATPGKRFQKLIVCDTGGQRLNFKKSIIRSSFACLSTMAGFLGHFVALFSPKGQCLHDLIADSEVVEGELPGDILKAWVEQVQQILK